MTDKVAKLLAKLPKKDLRHINTDVRLIVSLKFEGLDIKVLKGHRDTFRVKTGNCRIIFRIQLDSQPYISAISRKNEKTYKDF